MNPKDLRETQQPRLLSATIEQPHYGNWIWHKGVEQATNRIANWLVKGGNLWLTSDSVCGKTHFMQALANEHPHLGYLHITPNEDISTDPLRSWLSIIEQASFWAIDLPAGVLNQETAYAIFHLIEYAKERQKPMLISWRSSQNPSSSQEKQAIPPELLTRLHTYERIEMEAPKSDEKLIAILHSLATSLQWQVKEHVLKTLISQYPRQLELQTEALITLEKNSIDQRNRHLTRDKIHRIIVEH
ncbi:MAG: hypothetical protein HQM07_03315 [Zetaproteobacteria bacterium]|nr:hypothetical protein [Zetaproteobacteria bacterium]